MDNIETMENFEQEVEDKSINEEYLKLQDKLRADLKEYKPFKDLLVGKEDEWKAIKTHVGLYAFATPQLGNQAITSDFIYGIRFCLELIESRQKAFDDAYNQLGKGE